MRIYTVEKAKELIDDGVLEVTDAPLLTLPTTLKHKMYETPLILGCQGVTSSCARPATRP